MFETIDPRDFDFVINKLRTFFKNYGFIECHPQSKLSIMSACEDPETVATHNYEGHIWPMKQTNQMELENILLKNPALEHIFCVTTSYRDESDPIPGRHNKIFPMFEFEFLGNFNVLINFEQDLCQYLGFSKQDFSYPQINYEIACVKCDQQIIDDKGEEKLQKDFGNVVFLKFFPQRTSPFWNMKKNDKDKSYSNKCDVIIHGIETIGSAERSCNKEEMKESFMTISNGMYAKTLFAKFTKERVMNELNEYLSFDMIPRVGGGIGITRLISGMKKEGLL